MIRAGLASVALLASASVSAKVTVDVPYDCPVGGEHFTSNQRVAVTQDGKLLDLKGYGNYEGVWPIIVACPRNGFVIYKKDFTPKELETLAAYIATPEYRQMKDAETLYYRAAKMSAAVGEKDSEIAVRMLAATWEARNPAEYARYAREALSLYLELLTKRPEDKASMNWELLAGELERRLGLFDEARARFERLQADSRYQEAFFAAVVALQLELVAAKNAEAHKLPPRPEQAK